MRRGEFGVEDCRREGMEDYRAGDLAVRAREFGERFQERFTQVSVAVFAVGVVLVVMLSVSIVASCRRDKFLRVRFRFRDERVSRCGFG